jgi:F-box/leucine-rich repeat protein 9
VNAHFQRLYLTALSIDERTVCCIAESLPGLTHLDLGHCFGAVTDTSIQAVWEHQVWLRSLKVTQCDKVTDAGLTGLALRTGGSEQTNRTGVTRLVEREICGMCLIGNDGVLHIDPLHRISLRSRAEQDIVNDAKRKEVVLQMCEDQNTEQIADGFSLVRLRGTQC